jgi:hypothetical protein
MGQSVRHKIGRLNACPTIAGTGVARVDARGLETAISDIHKNVVHSEASRKSSASESGSGTGPPAAVRKIEICVRDVRKSSTSFVNTYEYCDFRGDPDALMKSYFDAFVYVANWGTRQLMLRVPSNALDRRECAPYCKGDYLRVQNAKEHLILSFQANEIESDWEEGEGWTDSLIPLRAELLRGDVRALYLGWLLAAGSALLIEVAVGDTPHLADLLRRFRSTLPKRPANTAQARRTGGEQLSAAGSGRAELFKQRCRSVAVQHLAKPSFLRRLRDAGLEA